MARETENRDAYDPDADAQRVIPAPGSVFGELDDVAETDPDAETANVVGLLRGILATLLVIADNTTPAP